MNINPTDAISRLITSATLHNSLKIILALIIVYCSIEIAKRLGNWIMDLMKNLSIELKCWIEKLTNKHKIKIELRKQSSIEIKKLMNEFIINNDLSRTMTLEYSNGSSNFAGLPFLYLSFTNESTLVGNTYLSLTTDKLNSTLFAQLIIDLDRNRFLIFNDYKDAEKKYPILDCIFESINIKSIAFSLISGRNGDLGILILMKEKFPWTLIESHKIVSLSYKIADYLDV